MDMSKQLNSNTVLKHRPLTPARVIRGILCLFVILLTAFMMLIYCAPMTAVLLRFFSIHYSRKATSFFFGIWLALWPFFFEKINKTKVVFAGDSLPAKERVLLIANHRTEVDWMYLWDLALRKGSIGYIKYILKSSLMKLPIFGWVFHVVEFIPVQRKWELDESIMREMLSTFTDRQDPLWLALFPEGTDFTQEKCTKSQKFAAEKGLPVLQNVLLPKTKGLCICLEVLKGSMDAVYDVTIGYKHRYPCFMDNVFGVDPSEVHMHVQRIPFSSIPSSENEATAWLMNRFQLKDQLLADFRDQGHFPSHGTEGDLSTFMCLVNLVLVITLTSFCAFLTFFSSCFKIYVALSCCSLAFLTYFRFRPSPVAEIFKSVFSGEKQS
ncbi:hypothetical protein Scep_020696 [Stephania cephalantha]|uniref:1-acylglycerol-3-phosphate O-acyltransferase n=1 Tax=Stephania cephalantha TaxID=152367 RepID=A0AAP0IED1_9MAGN